MGPGLIVSPWIALGLRSSDAAVGVPPALLAWRRLPYLIPMVLFVDLPILILFAATTLIEILFLRNPLILANDRARWSNTKGGARYRDGARYREHASVWAALEGDGDKVRPGDVRLISLNWLMALAERGGVLPRRQDLPEEAFLSSAQLRRIEQGARRGFDLAGLKEALERVNKLPAGFDRSRTYDTRGWTTFERCSAELSSLRWALPMVFGWCDVGDKGAMALAAALPAAGKECRVTAIMNRIGLAGQAALLDALEAKHGRQLEGHLIAIAQFNLLPWSYPLHRAMGRGWRHTKLIDPMRRRQGDSAAFYKRYARGDPHGEDEARKSTGRQTAHSACLRLRLYARGTMAALAHALAAWRGLLHHQDASATQAHAQRDTSTNRNASTGAIEKGDLVQSVYSWALDLAAFESEELLASARGSGGGDEMV
ncbi:hypothetical protein EMIHUDRAFT_456895 [Emiliania huxleyi CCMP1516]|uniref:Uncharacterized protein n=2 Tax=Emiliania huxleyi TaxID=2903 RepID=A0A0D3JZG5_EMIH1|nr:hypothetical protein EMIHUDRAFT_456895 [Emiliania huxleyi CCMP1516]EOD28900.1 hypothetical protein EMIHUDRAFT_456895 [Emiliania huxleyi CCMP1516]|eukprot:XP_005781329.1 hypothetical protein EMIHUDRAFT_456895 [Emiliania huxleyi CCMP1516]